MNIVYLLENRQKIGDELCKYSYIGIYATLEAALSAYLRVVNLKQFENSKDLVLIPAEGLYECVQPKGEDEENGFYINKEVVNSSIWSEGFEQWPESFD